jgi:hypothetical protein
MQKMNGQGDFAATLTGWAHQAGEIALGWLSSPAAWSQFGLLAVAYLVARLAAARATPFVTRLLDSATKAGPLANARRFALRFVPLMLPLIAYGLTALGEEVTRATFGGSFASGVPRYAFGDEIERLIPRDAFELTRALRSHTLQRIKQTLGMMDALGVTGDLRADDASRIGLVLRAANAPDALALDDLHIQRAGRGAIMRADGGAAVDPGLCVHAPWIASLPAVGKACGTRLLRS